MTRSKEKFKNIMTGILLVPMIIVLLPFVGLYFMGKSYRDYMKEHEYEKTTK